MTYSETIKMSKEEFNYYNELLTLDLDNTSDNYDEHNIERLGAKQDDYIGIVSVEFANGNYITIDLASGTSNYYDNIVLWNKDGQELNCSDCNFSINNFELFYEDDIYEVRFELY